MPLEAFLGPESSRRRSLATRLQQTQLAHLIQRGSKIQTVVKTTSYKLALSNWTRKTEVSSSCSPVNEVPANQGSYPLYTLWCLLLAKYHSLQIPVNSSNFSIQIILPRLPCTPSSRNVEHRIVSRKDRT